MTINYSISISVAFIFRFLFINNAIAQQITFERYYDTLGCYYGNCVQQTYDGGYVLCGSSYSATTAQDAAIIKTDSLGRITWVKIYGGPDTDGAVYIEQTSDSGYIVIGEKDLISTTDSKTWLLKLDSNGDTLWSKIISLGTGANVPTCIRQTNDTSYIITGYTSARGAGNYDVYLVKTDLSGDTLWVKTFGGNGYDMGYSLQQTMDSGYIITGYTDSYGAGVADIYLIKTNDFGDTLWTRTFGDSLGDVGQAIEQTFDSGFIISGYTWNVTWNQYNICLIKTNMNGDTSWTKRIGDSLSSGSYSVQQTNDTGYIIAGRIVDGLIPDANVWLVKTNPLGDTLWSKQFGGTSEEDGYFVRQTKDGGYVITGVSDSYAPNSVYLVKTDGAGYAVTGTDELHAYGQLNILIYPNPFYNKATIILPDELKSARKLYYEIYDITGRKVKEEFITSESLTFTIDRNNFTNGLYFLKLMLHNDLIAVSKFIVQ